VTEKGGRIELAVAPAPGSGCAATVVTISLAEVTGEAGAGAW